MFMPEVSPELAAQLEPVYHKIAKAYPGEITARSAWMGDYCQEWTKHAKPIVASYLGPAAVIKQVLYSPSWAAFEQHGLNPHDLHRYVIDVRHPEDPTIIDGTWQQFANPALVIDAPRVMVAPVSKFPEIVDRYGIDPSLAYQWQPHVFDHEVFLISA